MTTNGRHTNIIEKAWGKLRSTSLRTHALGALVVVGVAAASASFTNASFNSNSSNPNSSFSAGNLLIANSKSGTAIVSASGMAPGVTRTGNVTITNNGDVAGNFTLAPSGLTDSSSSPPLSSIVDLTVEDITTSATTVYSGKLSAFYQRSLGGFAVGAAKTFKFTLSWPSAETDADLQGATASVTFRWGAST